MNREIGRFLGMSGVYLGISEPDILAVAGDLTRSDNSECVAAITSAIERTRRLLPPQRIQPRFIPAFNPPVFFSTQRQASQWTTRTPDAR